MKNSGDSRDFQDGAEQPTLGECGAVACEQRRSRDNGSCAQFMVFTVAPLGRVLCEELKLFLYDDTISNLVMGRRANAPRPKTSLNKLQSRSMSTYPTMSHRSASSNYEHTTLNDMVDEGLTFIDQSKPDMVRFNAACIVVCARGDVWDARVREVGQREDIALCSLLKHWTASAIRVPII